MKSQTYVSNGQKPKCRRSDLYISPEALEQLKAELPSPEAAAEFWKSAGLTEEQVSGQAESQEVSPQGAAPVDGVGGVELPGGPVRQPAELAGGSDGGADWSDEVGFFDELAARKALPAHRPDPAGDDGGSEDKGPVTK